MAMILVAQYFEFARELVGDFAVMDRGGIVMRGTRAEMVKADV
jgi:urea transport system ATP-binding protein